MRINGYITGLGYLPGLGDDSSPIDFSAILADPTTGNVDTSIFSIPTASGPTYVDSSTGVSITSDQLAQLNANVNSIYGPPVTQISNPSSANSWTKLLQSVIGTGVQTAAKIATVQNSVPNVTPGETYSYNAKTGSYVVSNQAGLVASSANSLFSGGLPEIAILGGVAALAIFLISKHR